MGRVAKGVKCSVSGCGKEAKRSLSAIKVRMAGLTLGSGERRAYLCESHYKDFKKKTKKERKIEQWRYKGV
ncbi:hypothetical protein KEJ32_07175 [Candidatus Bathyarchaeota archaeon]|nr:hypothetical protein [Candidatus Bathyarchaeota archaeon]MBS7637065.1 hypothetical protein [Candidatus Bathyarchaeota archaeon]